MLYRCLQKSFCNKNWLNQGSCTKQCVFKVSRSHPSKVAKTIPIIVSGMQNMEYLISRIAFVL